MPMKIKQANSRCSREPSAAPTIRKRKGFGICSYEKTVRQGLTVLSLALHHKVDIYVTCIQK